MSGRKQLADHRSRKTASKDFSKSIAVEAAAGTGKTEALAQRAVNAIKNGKAVMERIAAITFTRKAAGELQVRLRRKLSDELRENPEEKVSIRLRKAIKDIEKAHLSTIHSFCERLLKDDPFPVHLDPGFRIIDEVEAELLFQQVSRRWMREQGNTAGSALEAVVTRELPFFKKKLLYTRIEPDDILSIASKMNKKGVRDLPPKPRNEAKPQALLQDLIRDLLKEFGRFDFAPSDVSDTNDKLYSGLVRIRDGLQEAASAQDWLETTEILSSIKLPRKGCGSKGNWNSEIKLGSFKDLFRDFKEYFKEELEETLHKACCSVSSPVLRQATEMAFDIVNKYRERKSEEGLVDFHDLLLFCDNLLKSEESRKILSDQFDLILVDECQDVDPLQLDIILRLTGKGDPESDDYRCDPGKLFFVGDPKQSIFYFRGADLQAYNRARDRIMAGSEYIQFSQNFRSRKQICSAVNRSFKPVMQGQEHQAKYVDLQPYREEDDGPAVIRLQIPEERITSRNLGDLRKAEAEAAADFLQRLMNDELPFPLNVTEKDGTERPAKLSDVLILLHAFGQENWGSSSRLTLFEKALEEKQVPYVTIGGKEYFARHEVKYAYALLRILVEPYDEMMVAATLRGPFAAIKDQEMLQWKLKGGSFSIKSHLPEGVDKSNSVYQAILRLIELRKIALDTTLSIRNRVELILSRSGMMLTSACDRNGTGRVGNLFKIVSLADTAENAGIVTYSGYLKFLRDRIDDRTKAEELVLDTGTEMDAARIMTVHKAKGLEEKIVILAGWFRSVRNKLGPVLAGPQGDIVASAGKVLPGEWEEAVALEKARQEAEFCRLGYVAATRARDWLVAVQYPDDDKLTKKMKGPLQPLLAIFRPGISREELKQMQPPQEVIDLQCLKEEKESQQSAEEASREKPQQVAEASSEWSSWISEASRKGNTTLRIESAKQVEDGVFDLKDIEVTVSTPQLKDDKKLPMDESSNRRGELVHELMRAADLSPLLDQNKLQDQVKKISSDLKPLAEGMVANEGWKAKEVDVLLAFTARLLSTPIMKKVAGAERVMHEVPFSCVLKSKQNEDILVEGIADLVFKDRSYQLSEEEKRMLARENLLEAREYYKYYDEDPNSLAQIGLGPPSIKTEEEMYEYMKKRGIWDESPYDQGQWWVADYKTGFGTEKRLKEKHYVQLALYAKSLSEYFGTTIQTVLIGVLSDINKDY